MTDIKHAAVIGAGVIGGGWAARLACYGIPVSVYDPNPNAERRIRELLENAERVLTQLPLAHRNWMTAEIRLCPTVADAVADADYIQENAPEREDLKRSVLAEIDAHARPDALIGSSTSGLLPSKLQADMKHPERFFVAHPFNPVYLLPLVELCPGEKTDWAHIERAADFLATIDMKPLKLRKEIDGFVADRLMEAMWRESLWLVHDDIATVEEVDDAIRYAAGLRWALMGSFQVFRVAGGEEGMRHFMAQFGPALLWPWTKLMDVPQLTDEFLDKIADQSDAQCHGYSISELERIRDDGLVAILNVLAGMNWGAGSVFNRPEKAAET